MLLLCCRCKGAGINQPFNLSVSQNNDCVTGDGKSHWTSVDKTKCVSDSHWLGSTKCQLAQQGSAENENNLKGKNVRSAEKPLKRQASLCEVNINNWNISETLKRNMVTHVYCAHTSSKPTSMDYNLTLLMTSILRGLCTDAWKIHCQLLLYHSFPSPSTHKSPRDSL